MMRAVIISMLLSISLSAFGSEMDYQKIKKQYTKADYVVFEKTITISYFINQQTGELNARSLYNVTMVALNDDCDMLKNIQVPFNEFEDVTVLSAKYFTISATNELNLAENVKVKFLKSKDFYISGIFYNDQKVKEITATIPIKEKTVVKYSYEYLYRDTRFLNSLHIQEDNENVMNFSLTITIPEFVNTELHSFQIPNPKDIQEKTENGTKVISYKAQNISSKKEHAYSPSYSYFSPTFVLTTKSYTNNGKTTKILESASDLYVWYANLVRQLKPDKPGIKKLADEITAGKNTPAAKIESIFKWVQKSIHYVAFEDGIAGFKPEEAQKVIATRYGDCKGMANTLVELLKAEGITAYHTWIGTRHIKYPLSTNSLVANNHMICAVYLNNEIYYLDATDKGAFWNQIPAHLQGKDALIDKDTNFEIKTIPTSPIGNNVCDIHFECSFSSDYRNLNTLMETNLEGNEALEIYNAYNFSDVQTREKMNTNFTRIFTRSFVPDSASANIHSIFTEEKIASKNKGKIIGATIFDGKKLYLFLNQYLFLNKLPLRNIETPVQFDYKKKIIVTYSIQLPNKFRLNALPPAKTFKTTDNAISCTINYSLNANTLTVKKEILIDTLLLEINTTNWLDVIEEIRQEENTPLSITSII